MSKIRLHGSSSGYTEIAPVAASGNNTLRLPDDGTILSKDAAGAVGVTSIVTTTATITTAKIGAGVTISESGIEASGIGITCANINGAQIGGRRNIIINGAMQVAQRGTSTTTVPGYLCDRWRVKTVNTDNVAMTVSQDATSYPTDFTQCLKIDITTAETTLDSNEYLQVQQRIEAQDLQQINNGTSNAKPLVLSFYVKAYQAGNYVVSIYKDDNTQRVISLPYTINASATWERKVLVIPGDTSGGGIANDTGIGYQLDWFLAAGSDYTSTDSTSWINWASTGYAYGQAVNTMSSTDNYWQITGVQLEVGSQVTPFEHRSYGEELRLCSRYYQRISGSNGTAIAMAFNYNTSLVDWVLQYPMGPMRAGPSLDQSTGSDYFQYQGSVDGVVHLDGSFVIEQSTTTQANIYFDPDGSLTHGGIGYILVDNSSASLALSSEL